ncbi:uncharacterized protein N7482_009652 [Penicillium canariense]|uniref:Rhodopsin domain-containing protein n=1 Tax=Penicillium canariense TaxID=189055 RepID=A0A9W9LFX0_9EURO|nr:uncharacterized protein N7482_009652 [Penicillium canariense]KAJ5153174.1 hypothetical protein N7482_009652 [Penicillium canariense]
MVDHHQQHIALGVVVAFPILGGLSVLLRLWSRRLLRSALTIDIKTNYVGIHFDDIPKDYDAKEGYIWNFANQILYNPTLTVVKLSILAFLRRLESRSRIVNLLIWTSFVIVIGLFIAVLFVDIFQCHPVAYVYDLSIVGGKCIEQGNFYVSTAALNLFTDLLVMSIPILITWNLQMPLRRKLAVCIVLCLGGVATAIGVWRIVILAQVFVAHEISSDPTYAIGFVSSAIEVNVAVITACAPSLKAIAGRYLPRLLGTSRGETSGYGPGNSGSRGQYPGSKPFSNKSQPRSAQLRSHADDGYEMADPNGGHTVDIDAGRGDPFDMRKYRRGGDSPSVSSGSVDGVVGIVKTTDVSVQYTIEGAARTQYDGRSREAKHSSVDSLV